MPHGSRNTLFDWPVETAGKATAGEDEIRPAAPAPAPAVAPAAGAARLPDMLRGGQIRPDFNKLKSDTLSAKLACGLVFDGWQITEDQEIKRASCLLPSKEVGYLCTKSDDFIFLSNDGNVAYGAGGIENAKWINTKSHISSSFLEAVTDKITHSISIQKELPRLRAH